MYVGSTSSSFLYALEGPSRSEILAIYSWRHSQTCHARTVHSYARNPEETIREALQEEEEEENVLVRAGDQTRQHRFDQTGCSKDFGCRNATCPGLLKIRKDSQLYWSNTKQCAQNARVASCPQLLARCSGSGNAVLANGFRPSHGLLSRYNRLLYMSQQRPPSICSGNTTVEMQRRPDMRPSPRYLARFPRVPVPEGPQTDCNSQAKA